MDCVVSLKQISSREGHVAGEAFERLDVSMRKNMPFEMLIPSKGLPTIRAEDHLRSFAPILSDRDRQRAGLISSLRERNSSQIQGLGVSERCIQIKHSTREVSGGNSHTSRKIRC